MSEEYPVSLNQMEQDLKAIKNARIGFSVLSVATWLLVFFLIKSVSTFTAVLMIAAALISCIMPVASHFAYKQRKAELDKIR